MNLGTDGVGGVFSFFELVHGDDATGIYGKEGNLEFVGNAGIMGGGNEGWVVVSNDGGCVFGKFVESIVSIGALGPQVKDIADA